jgi:hypothetical protein
MQDDDFDREMAEIYQQIDAEVDRRYAGRFEGADDATREGLIADAKREARRGAFDRWLVMRERAIREEQQHQQAQRRAEWKHRPLTERAAITTGRETVRLGKVVGVIIVGLIAAAVCGILLSVLFGGPGCESPWFGC